MQVVVLAGGLGTRIQSVARGLPKSMVPVAGVPFIEHQLGLLRAQGLRDLVVCTGYGSTAIESHVRDGSSWEMRVQYSREESETLLGTGGALVNALPLLADTFLVMYGDSYLTTDFSALSIWNRDRQWPAVMSVYRNEGRLLPSNVAVTGEQVALYSKAGGASCLYIDYGLSLYNRAVIARYANRQSPFDLGTIQADLAAEGSLGAFIVQDRFYEVGSPDGLAELEALLLARSIKSEA